MGWKQHGLQRTFRTGQLIQLVQQDIFDAPVTVNFIGAGVKAGRFESPRRVFASKSQDSQASAESLLRMLPRSQFHLNHLGGQRANLFCPMDKPLWRPLAVEAVLGGHMFRQRGVPSQRLGARMAADPLLILKEFEGLFICADLDFPGIEVVRNGIVVAFKFYVVIDIDPGFFPGGEFVRRAGQRFECGLIV